MAKQINIIERSKIGDVQLVSEMSKFRGLNNGKGFSVDYVMKVKNKVRKNENIIKLFIEVIENRQELMRSKKS